MNTESFPPKKFQHLVLAWFDEHGRKTLPWQQRKNPYRIWVSEIMLQQTQVATVLSYYERFMQRFPDIQSLANAAEDEVLHLWTGLGYYNRARNLHRTAKLITENFQGNFPNDLNQLQSLPGIGKSTAGAILAIAFQQRAAILDGNVKRVLTRLHGITEWPGEKKVAEHLWVLAETYTPKTRIADYTQAMMDIGATLCVRGTPHCPKCPFQRNCLAFKNDMTKQLPKPKPPKILPVKRVTLLLLQKDNLILLEKRPPVGVWASLWSLPEAEGTLSASELQQLCKKRFRIKSHSIRMEKSFRHTFSHFHLVITSAIIRLSEKPLKIMDGENKIWYNLQQAPKVGLPAPIKKILMRLAHDAFNSLHKTQ